MISRILACAVVIVASGCALGTPASADVPALISKPTDASRAELQEKVSAALGTSVTLASDALTRSSTLAIERKPIRDANGRRIEVREREAPELFRLVKRDSQCILIRARTQTELTLNTAECAPE